jgi:predicted nucleic acid-binding protein
MKVLIDTNVVLDVLINNSAFFAHSKKIFDLAEQKQIIGFISASAITEVTPEQFIKIKTSSYTP